MERRGGSRSGFQSSPAKGWSALCRQCTVPGPLGSTRKVEGLGLPRAAWVGGRAALVRQGGGFSCGPVRLTCVPRRPTRFIGQPAKEKPAPDRSRASDLELIDWYRSLSAVDRPLPVPPLP